MVIFYIVKIVHIFSNHILLQKNTYEDYKSTAHTKKTQEIVNKAKLWANIRANLLDAFGKKGTVLELGCGHKYFLDELTKKRI